MHPTEGRWHRMTRNRLRQTCLAVAVLSLTGCPGPTEPPPEPAYEWDGKYVPLEEKGNWPTDPGRFSPCQVLTTVGANCDASNFELSACNTGSLANMATEGVHMLTTRPDSSLGELYLGSQMFKLRGAGNPVLLNGLAATEQQVGNARVFSVSTSSAAGRVRRTAVALCQAPQAPRFTGCYAQCVNGRISGGTFASDRMTWREGESEASGLQLVSENRVDIGLPADVYVTQGHAYVVSLNRGPRQGGLTVFDVRNPAAPVKVKTVQFDGDGYWNGVWAKGNALYVASAQTGLIVFDITEPANPRFVTSLPSGGGNNHTVFVDGNRLYATVDTSVVLFDITTPTQPVELNRYSSADGFSFPHDMLAIGDRLYVNFADVGYDVVDVSDPTQLRTLGNFSYPYQYSHANAVGTFAGRTLSFMGGEGPGEHLRVLDITDPANIVKIGRFQLREPVSIHNMLLVGKKLYLSWYQEGVRVLDVSNPTQPTLAAYYNTFREADSTQSVYFEGAIGIRVPGDGYIYAVDTARGLFILREP